MQKGETHLLRSYLSESKLSFGNETPLLYQKVLIDSKAQLATQKLETQLANYNLLLDQSKVDKTELQKLT